MAWWEEPHTYRKGYLGVWSRDTGPAQIVLITLLSSVAYVIGINLLVSPAPAIALAVPLAAVFGPAGVWGIGFGVVIGGLATGASFTFLLTVSLAAVAASIISRSLWIQLAHYHRIRLHTAVLAIVPVAFIGSTTGAGAAAVGITLIERVSFAAIIPSLLGTTLFISLIVAPPIVGIGTRWGPEPERDRDHPPTRWATSTLLACAIVWLWVSLTYVLDLLRTDVRVHPELRAVIDGFMPPGIDLLFRYASGEWGWTLHLLLGVGGLCALVWVLGVPSRSRIRFRDRITA